MARFARLGISLATFAAATGCIGGLGSSEHSLAKDLTVVAAAGTTWHLDFNSDGGEASYSFRLTDDSSVDIGFMRTQNVQAYSGGSSATLYGGQQSVRSATSSTTLEAGAWSLVIYCRNVFADCDGILDKASYRS